MALFVRIVGGDIESIGPLPHRARRLDTNELVDPADWLRACGYYNVETATLADLPQDLTPQQRAVIIDAVLVARSRLEARRFWLIDTREAWALAKEQGQNHLEGIPPPPAPANTVQSVIYLYERVQQITRWIVGGGTIHTPGLGDILKLTVEVVNDMIEQADDVEPEA